MNEIFVEEENTVYELDPECLKRKEEQRKRDEESKKEKRNDYQMQRIRKGRKQSNLWVICLLLLIIR